jgi:AcrR family transcriptional regulator
MRNSQQRFTKGAANARVAVIPASPADAPVGRRQRRAVETRMRLFRCALALIAERGLPNVTVEDITEAADVGKGTFFNYFESKDHVLGVMAEIQIGKIRDAKVRFLQGKGTVQATLRQLAQQLAEEPGRSPELARALLSSFLGSVSVREIVKRTMHEGRKTIGELISAGQERGNVDPDLKKEKAAMQFLQAILGTLLIWSLHETPALNTWIDESFQHFWRSISVSSREQEP